MFMRNLVAGTFAILLTSAAIAGDTPRLGQPISEADIKAWVITILADGTNLPPGKGTAAEGAKVFAEKCAACHGDRGDGDGPMARDSRIRPANLNEDHLWEHLDGDLYWWIAAGMRDPTGAPAMPAFAPLLPAERIWAAVAFAKARSLSALIPRRYRDVAFDRPPVTEIDAQVVMAVRRFADRIDEMVDEHLLGEGQRASEALASEGDALGEGRIDLLDEFDGGTGGHGHVVLLRLRVVDKYKTSVRRRQCRRTGHFYRHCCSCLCRRLGTGICLHHLHQPAGTRWAL